MVFSDLLSSPFVGGVNSHRSSFTFTKRSDNRSHSQEVPSSGQLCHLATLNSPTRGDGTHRKYRPCTPSEFSGRTSSYSVPAVLPGDLLHEPHPLLPRPKCLSVRMAFSIVFYEGAQENSRSSASAPPHQALRHRCDVGGCLDNCYSFVPSALRKTLVPCFSSFSPGESHI
jgi:hypothetical protein